VRVAGLAVGVVVKGLRVLDKDIIALDVEEGVLESGGNKISDLERDRAAYLSKISRVGLLVVVLVNQVGL
jgi:hypothetical protein